MGAPRIVIADDNRQIRMLASAALRADGYDLVEAEDGEAALECVFSDPPDLLLLDVMMPKLDGFEVLRFMRERPETCETKVIMLTTAGSLSDMQTATAMECSGYIVKPFEPGALRDAVTKVLES